MKQLLSIMLMCVLFSCTNNSDKTEVDVLNKDLQMEKVISAENEMKNYLVEIQTDVERRKRYVAEVNQKPNDEAWRLECFRKHYGELRVLMENIKSANYELQRLEKGPSKSEQKID